MKYKADSNGNVDKEKMVKDVVEAFKRGDVNMTVEVDMTDYVNALIQKSLRDKEKNENESR